MRRENHWCNFFFTFDYACEAHNGILSWKFPDNHHRREIRPTSASFPADGGAVGVQYSCASNYTRCHAFRK